MGERVDVNVVCKGVVKVEIIVYFLLIDNYKVKYFFNEYEFIFDEDENSCFIWCIILKEGCFKVFINGVFVLF